MYTYYTYIHAHIHTYIVLQCLLALSIPEGSLSPKLAARVISAHGSVRVGVMTRLFEGKERLRLQGKRYVNMFVCM
jgi:hypothetical protein